MTQYYRMPSFSLRAASLSTKVLLTCFLLSTLAGYVVALLYFHDRTGLQIEGIQRYYQGDEEKMVFAKTRTELIASTHPHAFSMPMLLFILCHLAALCRISERLKCGLYLTCFGSAACVLAGPWLTTYYSAANAWFLAASGWVLTISFLAVTLLPLVEMWLPRRADEPVFAHPASSALRGAADGSGGDESESDAEE
ncbi:MAG: hypothetical protein HZA54_10155 [Planctomycetes bacterium]|nr:hypothetical protein [Planctomycetota bacterium]